MTTSRTDKPCILAIDDSPIIQVLIREALERDYRVLATGQPMQALTLIYEEPVELLLLDVTMPDINGLELCRTIRSIPQFQTLPIVMITSRDTPFDRVQGQMAGANEYIIKPFSDDHIRATVRRLIASAAET